MGTKIGRIQGKGAPFDGMPQTFEGEVAPNSPLGSPIGSMSQRLSYTKYCKTFTRIKNKKHVVNHREFSFVEQCWREV